MRRVVIFAVCLALFAGFAVSVHAQKKGPIVDKIYVNVKMKEEIGLQDAAEGLTDIFFYGVDYTDIHNKKKVTGRDGNSFFKSTPAGWEFYDLVKDPHEMNNCYRDPEYQKVIQSLKKELKRLRKEIGDTDEENPRIREIINACWDK